MGKIKVGIIGTGFGAKVHAPMMDHHEGFQVVAISSVSRGNI
ncbi:MAG: Gfo/Idh/MocA family oxidoreductase [Mesobacillus sp.]